MSGRRGKESSDELARNRGRREKGVHVEPRLGEARQVTGLEKVEDARGRELVGERGLGP
jgi:hypothetical protein